MRKFYLDILILALFMLVMSFQFIPRILHEILGLLMMTAMLGHFAWNIKAFKALRGTTKKRLSMFVDIALILCLIVIIFTGICISNYIFNGMIDMKLQRDITIHQLHVSIPFLFMILGGLHLGLHWQGFRQRFNNLINVTLLNSLKKVAIASLIGIGIYGSFLNRIGDRLLMHHIFATKATELPFIEFILLMSGIFALYVIIGYIFDKHIK